MLETLALLVKHHAGLGLGDDTRWRIDPGEGFGHPVQGDQGQQRGHRAALGRTCRGGTELALLSNARCEPGFALPTHAG